MKLFLRILFILTLCISPVLAQDAVNNVLTNKVVVDGEEFYLYEVKAAGGLLFY